MRKKTWIVVISILLVLVMFGCSTTKVANEESGKDVISDKQNEDSKEEVEKEAVLQFEDIHTEESQEQSKVEYPLDLWFSSGAGGWGTNIIIYEDGRFTGTYQDSEWAEEEEEYPKGTCYICDFSGKFSNITQVNEYAYSLTLETLTIEKEVGTVYIEDGTRYVCCEALGLLGADGKTPAKKFMLYKPGTPLSTLPEDFLMWWGGRYGEPKPYGLDRYGLRNVETEDGFFS